MKIIQELKLHTKPLRTCIVSYNENVIRITNKYVVTSNRRLAKHTIVNLKEIIKR